MTVWSYIVHIRGRIMQNKWPKLGINIHFSHNFISVTTFYPNTVYLLLPHNKEAFWVHKVSEKYEWIVKFYKNRENYVNYYVVVLTPFSHCYKATCKKNLIYIYVFLTFYAPLSLIMVVLSIYCPKYEMERQLLHVIQFHFSAPMLYGCFLISQLNLTHESSL